MLPSLSNFKSAHGRLLMMMPGEKVSVSDEGFWQSSLTLHEPNPGEALVLQFCITESDPGMISVRLDMVFYEKEKVQWRSEVPLESTSKSMSFISDVCRAHKLPVDASIKASTLIPAALAIQRASVQIH